MNLLQKIREEPIPWAISLVAIIAIPPYAGSRASDSDSPASQIVQDISNLNSNPRYECRGDSYFEVYGEKGKYLVVKSSESLSSEEPWSVSAICSVLSDEPPLYVLAGSKRSDGEYQPQFIARYTACSSLYNRLETMLNEPRQECPQPITRKRKYPRRYNNKA